MEAMKQAVTASLDGQWSLAHCHIGEGSINSFEALRSYEYQVPGDVHSVFLREGIISDPLCDLNDAECRWLEDEEFWCRRVFLLDEADLRRHMQLTFDGLDCTADIWFNRVYLGRTNNALVEMTFDVSAAIHAGENELVVRIDQGLQAVQEKELLQMDQMWNNVQPYRAWMRKPQYVYGWDWTIWLPSCGIWRSVHLDGWEHARIRDAYIRLVSTEVSERGIADLQIDLDTECDDFWGCHLECRILDRNGIPVTAGSLPARTGTSTFDTSIAQARLWWPNGMGTPYLYQVEIRLLNDSGATLQTIYRTLGIRTVALREEKLSDTESGFTFIVNGVPIFCKGANVVPEDCLPGCVKDEHTRESIRLAKEANMNMLRVWGGGVYASEAFLDACDRAGIMVWHDFMFACGYHPDHDRTYMRNVSYEAERAILRLRNHSCVIGWSGNNEIQEMYAGQKRWNPQMPFYGEKIFTQLLPDKVSKLHPGTIYRESSPLGGENPADIETGDQHIWHFTHRPNDPRYLDLWRFTDFRAKFLSEFGLIGAMNIESARRCISPEHLHPDDPVWLHHTNDSAEHQLLNMFVRRYFGEYDELSLQQYILRSQAIQAEITRHIYDEFRARKFECSGLLFWTLGDSLGMHNWSILDYYLHKRPVYHYLKRSMAPLTTAIRGYDVQNSTGMQGYREYWADKPAPLEIRGMNDTLRESTCVMQWQLITVDGQKIRSGEKLCTIAANNSQRLETVDVYGLIREPERTILHVALLQDGTVIHENRYFFAPFAKMLCPNAKPRCKAEKINDGEWRVTLTSDSFVWMLHLETPDGTHPSDNDFDLLPGVPRTIIVHTDNAGYVPRYHWLGEPDH